MSGVLVVYYSGGGNSKKIAQDISTKLNGVIDEITLEREAKGTYGYLKNIFDAYFENTEAIKYEMDPKNFTSIVIVSPIVAGRIPSAVRQYVVENLDKMENYGFIMNSNYTIQKKSFKRFRDLMPEFIAEFATKNTDIDFEFYCKSLEDFADRIRIVEEKEDQDE
jgi:menaquinone-dependent protoporphyrinogen IX oxidase